ncbi:DUF4097 family beta strand repeat-containing protein [Spirosoma sp. KUDC1026]|uniref:DUF4097 family beta strand repeat-containing protein n=1 Tax=Spirosoma sp. KUDC1026 TaxID=2745947 RepID=UPI00159BA7CD|nr:DUF4097 family beta strand repeat-containing protein [Spirosoma sp. KUDC1026]QKZ14761.1 DUF4097 family beta strand repeat protein [Spirosoma sp. KUDC1026]
MKKVLLAGILCLGHWSLYAQEFKTKLAPTGKITIQLDASNLKIEGYNGSEVIIQSSAKLEAPPERAKGLRPLYNSAVDNTGLGLSVTSEGGNVRIEKASRKSLPYTIRVPQKAAILYEQTNWTTGDITIQNVEGDLELRTNNVGLNLVDVTGPVVANTISGEIKVVYSSLNQSKPTAMSTVNGAIDITMPASTRANLKLSSIHGEMYTDFDLGMTKKDGMTRMGGGHQINGATNGGGVDLQLKTINSDIYIRKQK